MEGPPVHDNVLEVLRLIAGRKSFSPPKGKQSAEVTAIQRALIALGFSLRDDGFFGPQTAAAVARLQESLDLKPTGTPNVETVNILLDVIQDPSLQDQFRKKIGSFSFAPNQSTSAEKDSEQPAAASKGYVLPQTISDGAINDVSQDALGFTSYVYGVQQFLAAKETRPPLAIGITARWGQGKTSFMRMLETELKRSHKGGAKFVTSWFNPWLYSDAEQLWNAFVSNISSCILHALPRQNRLRFHYRRFFYNLEQKVGFGLRFWLGLLTIVSTFVIFFYAVLSPVGGTAMFDMTAKYVGQNTAKVLKEQPALPMLLSFLGAVFLSSIFYYRVVKKLDLGLIDYLQKNDFAVKAGALVQFQKEMELLAEAVPDDLRVVIFIDDLDRCEEAILMEVISSLQVLTVSSKCYFVLGLDLAIVARQIEGSVLAQALEETDEKQHQFQHGSGFRFLEKVIQARLSVPHYSKEQIFKMVESLLPKGVGQDGLTSAGGAPVTADGGPVIAGDQDVAEDPRREAGHDEQIIDAPEIGVALTKYGPKYFDNPRSLKRFMNSFRMHAHLATIVDNGISTDQLARYFVLAECWPGLLDYFQHHPEQLTAAGGFVPPEAKSGTEPRVEDSIERLMQAAAGELFAEDEPLGGETIVRLCRWYGFRFYSVGRFSAP